jgi:hypothetical protein
MAGNDENAWYGIPKVVAAPVGMLKSMAILAAAAAEESVISCDDCKCLPTFLNALLAPIELDDDAGDD